MADQNTVNNNPNQAMLGLNTDNILQQVKPGTLTYALNAQIDSFDGQTVTYQNEQSNVLCSEFKTGFRVIGYHSIIEQDRTVIFSTNPHTGESEIGVVNNTITCDVDDPTNLNQEKSSNYVNNGYNNVDPKCNCNATEEALSFYQLFKKINPSTDLSKSCCQYTTLISGRCLNFNINYPIHKAVHRIVDINDDANKCGTEIYWADGLNPRRFMNLDDLPFEETVINNCDRVKSNILDCDLMEVQPTIKVPAIKIKAVTDGGSLVAGTYQFALQYTNDKGEGYTSYYAVTNPVGIFQKRYGLDYNFPTDKSIKVVVSNLDLKFKYFNLAVIKTINGVADPELVGTYEILKNSKEIVYSGTNKTQINLTMDDIFEKYPYYDVASEVTAAGDTLMWANLKGKKRLNYQSIGNRIKIQWMTWQLPYTERQSYFNGANTSLYKGYMRDEVYPLECVLLLKNGKETDGIHIPAREATFTDLTSVSNSDVITKELDQCIPDNAGQPRWKVYNTGSLIGTFPEFAAAPDPNCYEGPYQYGEMAYWESEKTYPCDEKLWGDLAGKPIRHHKFPDNIITHIHDSNPSASDKNFEHKVYPIGIKIDLENIRQAIIQSDLTDQQKSEIVGFKIVRGDRVNNKSVIAKGLLYNVGSYVPYTEGSPIPNQEAFYPNYPFNDLGDDPFLTNLSNVTDGEFNISVVNSLESEINATMQNLDSLESLITTVPASCYTAVNDCVTDTGGTPIIQVTNSEKATLQNSIFVARSAGTTLLNSIASVIAYYDAKIQNGEIICSTDVAALTVPTAQINTFKTDVNNIDFTTPIVNWKAVVTYINTNSVTLDSHPKSTDIYSLRTSLITLLGNEASLQEYVPVISGVQAQYATALTDLAGVDCAGSVVNDSSFSRSRFTFHSPDTHFYQPFLGGILKVETLEGGKSIGNFVQVKDHAGHKLMSSFSSGLALGAGLAIGALFALEPKPHVIGGVPGPIYTLYYPDFPSIGTVAEKAIFWDQQFKEMINNLLPVKNYAYQYNAVGIYNKFQPIPNNGNKQRPLDKAYYLIPGVQTLGDTFPINNWKRESSVYFRTNQLGSSLLFPNDASIIGSLPEDSSRVAYSNAKQIYSDVLCYYASNKRKIPDQYGDIYSYSTVDTGYSSPIDIKTNYGTQVDFVFGGDVFINRFGLKRKLSYFIDNAVNKPDEIDIEYSSLSNIGKVKYWYNTSSAQTPNSGFKGLIKSILGVPQSNLDGNTNKLFYQNGRIYLYSYGIAYFFVESEVNVDYRQAGNDKDKDFFPNVGTGIPNDWLQETNVPIVHDNYYIYNKTYSKQNKESYVTHLPLTFDPDQECQQDYTHRVIWSDPNKWRIYKPLANKDLTKAYGKLTSIDAIDNNAIMVRFENKTFLHNVLQTINTGTQNAYLGNPTLFSAPPIDFGETDLGYAGSQHHVLLRTEAGHLFIDAKRGSVFLVQGNGVSCISDNGQKKWFGRNLPFNITNDFPEVPTDNHFNGIGICGVWDIQYERFIITKLDYEVLADKKTSMRYDSYYGKFFYKNLEVVLGDPRYFCNKSWTMSYSPALKAWVSLHSYLPNFYIGQNGTFLSGKNGYLNNEKSTTWVHNIVHTSYQTFYGKLEPYILEYPFVYKAQDEILQNIKDYTSILEYYNDTDFYEINDGVYFNKAILTNNQQTSGILNLYPKPKNKLNEYFTYPKYNADSKDIMFTKSDNFFNYNTFWDVVKNPNNHYPIWIDSCVNKSVDKELNNDKLDYSPRSHQKTKLRAKDLKVRHINDKYARYKFVSKFILAASQVSQK